MNTKQKTADRIKAARSIAGYAERKAFCSRFGFPLATLEAWERGKNPLTPKGAKRLVDVLREVGIYCSEEWLREGVGISPRPLKELSDDFDVNPPQSFNVLGDNLKIAREISTFIALNEEAIVTIIRDDAMLPFYKEGDYVGGIKASGPSLKNAMNKKCILELPSGKTVVRELHKGIDSNHFTLAAINLNTKAPMTEHNVELLSAAPIVWHRSV
jgi:hypothetical protein